MSNLRLRIVSNPLSPWAALAALRYYEGSDSCRRHLGKQVTPLRSRKLLNVPPPTTWVPRISLYTPTSAYPICFRLRRLPASSPTRPAESSSFYCGPPIRLQLLPPLLAMTQFPSATRLWLTSTHFHRAVCAPSRAHWEPSLLGDYCGEASAADRAENRLISRRDPYRRFPSL